LTRVGALRRQDDRDQKLQRIAEMQRDLRIRIALQQQPGDRLRIGHRTAPALKDTIA
jgi:hypothetical protein